MNRRRGGDSVIVAGVMSGTSADGINVALVSITDSGKKVGESDKSRKKLRRAGVVTASPTFNLLGHAEYPYSKDVRQAVLKAMNAVRASVADLARLNFVLGELYADAVLAAHKVSISARCSATSSSETTSTGKAASYPRWVRWQQRPA